jgi:hypothetical protein
MSANLPPRPWSGRMLWLRTSLQRPSKCLQIRHLHLYSYLTMNSARWLSSTYIRSEVCQEPVWSWDQKSKIFNQNFNNNKCTVHQDIRCLSTMLLLEPKCSCKSKNLIHLFKSIENFSILWFKSNWIESSDDPLIMMMKFKRTQIWQHISAQERKNPKTKGRLRSSLYIYMRLQRKLHHNTPRR